MHKTCPVTGLSIPRRYAVHRSVLEKLLLGVTKTPIGGKLLTIPSVIPNPVAGTLRRMVFDRNAFRAYKTAGGTVG